MKVFGNRIGRTGTAIAGAIVIVTAASSVTGCAAAPPADLADDGLVRVEAALLDELYVAPNVPLANYQRVMLDPIEVNFKDGWRLSHPELGGREFEQLRSQLAAALRETLIEELARGGYELAEAPAPDVLRLRASIVDVELAAPEMSPEKGTMVHSDGQMTLRLQGFDAPSGALVARAKDREEDPPTRIVEDANRVTAFKAAQQIFDEWAQELRSALDVAKVSAGARTPQP
jgi:hypothetical protein